MNVQGHKKREEVLQWLQDRVGPMLWSRPIVEYCGKGWHMVVQQNIWEIKIDDPKLHTLAILKFG